VPLLSLSGPRRQARCVLALAAVLGLASVLADSMAKADFTLQYYAINYYSYAGAAVFGLGRGPAPPPGPGPGGCGGVGCLGSNIGTRGFVVRQGHGVVVSGPVRCRPGEAVNLRVTVNQRRGPPSPRWGSAGAAPPGSAGTSSPCQRAWARSRPDVPSPACSAPPSAAGATST